MGRFFGSQQWILQTRAKASPLPPVGLKSLERVVYGEDCVYKGVYVALGDLVERKPGNSFAFLPLCDLLLVPAIDLTQLEAERQKNLPAQKARWSMDTERYMENNLLQAGTIISTF